MKRKNLKLKIFFLAILFLVFFGWADSSWAADHYVREGATGANDGSDWTNAWTALPATLTRGDTYYIADGNYSAYTVDDAENGAQYITIKKATTVAHGTNTGWIDGYGDGQAVFNAPLNILTSYVVFDGSVESGSDPFAYGFKVAPVNCESDNNIIVGIPSMGYAYLNLSNIAISHTSIIHCGASYNTEQRGIYSLPNSASNITISHNYFRDASTNLLLYRWSNSLIEGNYFAGNWSSSYSHGQQIDIGGSSDTILRNNIFENSTAFVLLAHGSSNHNWKVFNNIIVGGNVSGIFNQGDDIIDAMKNWEVHNNTVVGTIVGGYGFLTVRHLSDTELYYSSSYNNLFFGTGGNGYPGYIDDPPYSDEGAIIHDYNAWIDCANAVSNEANGQIGVGDPFADSASGDYRLQSGALAIEIGKTLVVPFNVDYLGVSRPQGAAWDIGAYEFVSEGDATPPAAPSNLSVQ